jgi:hypothetical protein
MLRGRWLKKICPLSRVASANPTATDLRQYPPHRREPTCSYWRGSIRKGSPLLSQGSDPTHRLYGEGAKTSLLVLPSRIQISVRAQGQCTGNGPFLDKGGTFTSQTTPFNLHIGEIRFVWILQLGHSCISTVGSLSAGEGGE